ncbi:MAG: lytic transglycosylase domain-containing protein [Dehalococcoidia bacterium]|nr:lytic transglycosylase domain-containing protein [Dehalococcoidia bacterium]
MPELIPYLIWAAISAATAKHGVDPLLFIAIGMTEKGHYAWTDAVIGDLSIGMSISPMQLYLDGAGAPPPGWTRQAWANELTKPDVWTDVAARFIRQNLVTFNGNVELAVAAYNRGPNGTVDNYQGYVVPVLANYQQLKTYGITVVGSGDHDSQTFIPSTGKWTGAYTEYAPNTGGHLEACVNLKGICDDALEAGRIIAAKLRETAEGMKDLADTWGTR